MAKKIEHSLGWLHGRLVGIDPGGVEYYPPGGAFPQFKVNVAEIKAISSQQGSWTGVLMKFHGHGSVLVEVKLPVETGKRIEAWFKPRIAQGAAESQRPAAATTAQAFTEQLALLAELHQHGALTDEE